MTAKFYNKLIPVLLKIFMIYKKICKRKSKYQNKKFLKFQAKLQQNKKL